MLSREELAKNLFGRGSAEEGERPSTASVMYGTAISDSEDGTVSIVPDNAIVSAPDGEDNTIYVPTSPAVQEGDTVMLIGAGEGRQPMSVVSVIGSGDRTAAIAADAKSAVDEAVEEVAAIEQEIADFKSGADVDYAIYEYVDDEVGELSTTVSATYLSKTEAQTTYATQSQLTQTAEDITASVSQNYVSKTDAQTTYATKSELNVGLEGIELEVSQNYATKDEAATTGEGSGESVTVDSGSMLRSLEVEGKSVQGGTPSPNSPVPVQVVGGANMIPPAYYAATRTASGITVTNNEDGTFTLNGTATATADLYLTASNLAANVIPIIANKEYRLLGMPSNNGAAQTNVRLTARVRKADESGNAVYPNDYGLSATFKTTMACYVQAIYVNVTSGTTLTNLVVKPQIAQSSVAEYVPYGSLGLKVSGKNLLNNAASLPTSLNGATYTSADNGGISATGTPTANSYVSLGYTTLSSGVYTASMSGDVVNMAMQVWAVNGTTRLQNIGSALIGTSLTFDTSSIANCTGVEAVFGRRANNVAVTGTAYFQIERGSTATPYTPYVDSLTPIPLQGNVLASLPDGTKDVLNIDSAGHVTLTKNTGEIVYDGSEAWQPYSAWDGNGQYCYYRGGAGAKGTTVPMCSHLACYTRQYFSGIEKPTDACTLDSGGSVTVRVAQASSNDFKTWLTSNNITVVYQLATVQTVDLGYITMPELADGCTVQILASLTPTFGASWYTENGAALADFATKSELQVTADGISSVVSTKVGSDEVISKINQSAEAIQIEAERIEFDGTVVFNAIKSETDEAYDAKGAALTVQANLAAEESERKAIYGTCSTAAGTAAKAVTCANFQLFTGVRIAVKFSTASTVAAPTLNVNGTGAKAIWYNNAVASSGNPVLWGANATLNFVYDGTVWVLDEKAPNYTITCTTDAATRDKAASVAGALVVNGTTVGLSFSKANTYASDSVRFNLSSTGAATIYVNRTGTSTTNTFLWPANVSFTFVRNGAGWYLSDNGQRKYITHISDNGVSIHAANNPTQNYLQLDSSEIGFYESGSKVARFKAREIDLGLAPTGPSGADLATKIAMNGGMFSIESSLTEPATSGGTDYQNSLTVMRARSDLLDNWQMTIDDKAFLTMSEMNYGYQTTLRVDGPTMPMVAGVDAISNSKTTNDGWLSLYGNRILFQCGTARIGETPGADLAITRVYNSYGFRVENAVFHATADMVVLPLQFASDSSIEFGFGNSTYVAATIPVAYAPKEEVRAVIFTTSDWSSVQIGWATIKTDGKIYLQAAWSVVWFGQAVWIRK